MKTLILVLIMALTLQADRILIPIGSVHNSARDSYGEEFNNINLGLGLEFDLYKNNNHSIRASMMALNDSYKNLMVTATIGYDYRLFESLKLGFDFGVTSKKKKCTPTRFKRGLIPIAFLPTLTYSISKEITATVLYVPSLKFKDTYIDGVTTLVLGYKFNI